MRLSFFLYLQSGGVLLLVGCASRVVLLLVDRRIVDHLRVSPALFSSRDHAVLCPLQDVDLDTADK